MSRAIVALLLLHAAAYAGVQTFSSLPLGAQANCIQLDSSGNIYTAGSFNQHVFAAKLTPDGSQLVYLATLGGSNLDVGQAIAVGSDGSAYVTGYTQSTDFPVTVGAMQTTVPPQGSILQQHGFALKLDAGGKVQYATYLGGASSARGNGMAIDGSGNAYITGVVVGNFSAYPTTPGAIVGFPGDSASQTETGFVLKLDSS